MTLESALQSLGKPAKPLVLLAIGAAILVGLHLAQTRLRSETIARQAEWKSLSAMRERSSVAQSDFTALRDLKAIDIDRIKKALSTLTQSRRALYESGLALQEEKRLLEKQWEIMTTYLLVDIPAQKIHVMRADQSLQSFSVSYATSAFGAMLKPMPIASQIISKERYAHPERGRSEQVNGQLLWTPPQVGTSVRANALGEYVMFFSGDIILHGPPKQPQAHEEFTHWCVGLSMPAAQRLYRDSFIGTKMYLKRK